MAARESTWDNETTHELNFDLEANQKSYATARRKGRYADNPHFRHADRWQRGYGWYGMNASLHVWYWDDMAPPELLCRQVESTEIYLRKARRSFRKLWGMYGDRERTLTLASGEQIVVRGVTWYDIHRAASSGKLTPQAKIPTKRGFVARARSRKVQLDPFESVMWEMLGEPIRKDLQNEIADEIRAKIQRRLAPKPRPGAVTAARPAPERVASVADTDGAGGDHVTGAP